MKNGNLKGSIILIIAAFIWGMAFVAQSSAVDLVPPFAINALRSAIAAVVLYFFWLFVGKKTDKSFFPKDKKGQKTFYIAAFLCGFCLSVSVNLQQFGLAAYPKGVASEARAAFLTALYVILVPIVSVFLRKRVSVLVWLGVIIATVGVYLLCFSGGWNGIYLGDALVFLCAISFTTHILAVDKYVGFTGGVRLSVMQFSVVAVMSAVLSLVFEIGKLDFGDIITASPQILYLGIMSSGVAYTLQIVGQRFAEPSVASLSMSLESVFGALGGWLLSGNALETRELLGCGLVFAAIVVAQLPTKKEKCT